MCALALVFQAELKLSTLYDVENFPWKHEEGSCHQLTSHQHRSINMNENLTPPNRPRVCWPNPFQFQSSWELVSLSIPLWTLSHVAGKWNHMFWMWCSFPTHKKKNTKGRTTYRYQTLPNIYSDQPKTYKLYIYSRNITQTTSLKPPRKFVFHIWGSIKKYGIYSHPPNGKLKFTSGWLVTQGPAPTWLLRCATTFSRMRRVPPSLKAFIYGRFSKRALWP